MRRFGYVLCALALAGCAAGYKPSGFNGGFSESWRAPDRVQVNFRGNAFNNPTQVQEMALLRAADLAREHGFSGFIVLSERDATTYGYMPQQATTNGYVNPSGGFSATTTTTGGMPIARAGSSIVVQFTNDPPSGPNAYSADFIEMAYGRKYKKS